MSRLSIEVTPQQHNAIKMAALEHGFTLKDFILDRFEHELEHKPAKKISSGAGHDDCPICRSYGKNREYNAKTLKALDDAKNKKGMMTFSTAQKAIDYLRS